MKRNSGFTLIEVLMMIFVMGIVVVMGSNLFFSIMKGASKAEIQKEVKQNGDYAMSIMEKMIRNAQEIVENSDDQICTASMKKIKIKNPDGGETEFGCLASSGITQLASSSALLTSENISLGSSCEASDLEFTCDDNSSPENVTISFTLYQAQGGKVEEKAQVKFQTKVSLRTY